MFLILIFLSGNNIIEKQSQSKARYVNISQIYLMVGKNISVTYQYPGNQKMTENGMLQKIYPDAIILKISNRKIRLIRSCYIKKIELNHDFF